MWEKRERTNHLSSPFKEKEKEGEGRPQAWWPMEGEEEGSLLGGQWKEKKKVPCYLFPLPLKQLYFKPSIFIL
jgi:hypothetical protein